MKYSRGVCFCVMYLVLEHINAYVAADIVQLSKFIDKIKQTFSCYHSLINSFSVSFSKFALENDHFQNLPISFFETQTESYWLFLYRLVLWISSNPLVQKNQIKRFLFFGSKSRMLHQFSPALFGPSVLKIINRYSVPFFSH